MLHHGRRHRRLRLRRSLHPARLRCLHWRARHIDGHRLLLRLQRRPSADDGRLLPGQPSTEDGARRAVHHRVLPVGHHDHRTAGRGVPVRRHVHADVRRGRTRRPARRCLHLAAILQPQADQRQHGNPSDMLSMCALVTPPTCSRCVLL